MSPDDPPEEAPDAFDSADGDSTGGGEARRRRLVAMLGAAPGRSRATPASAGRAHHRIGDGAGHPDLGGPGTRLGRVCALSVSEVGISGAGVTVMGGTDAALAGHRDQLWATDELVRRLEDLQLTAGEGPCLDAYTTGAPVLAGDMAAEPARWLGFAPEAIAAGAAAVFSLPLQVGAVRLGTLDLHRATAGPLSRAQLADALILASLATETLLEFAGDFDPDPDPEPDPELAMSPAAAGSGDPSEVTAGVGSASVGWLPGVHAEVHQASGMVAAHQHIGVGDALLRIRGHAFTHGEPIEQVARRVIDRDLVLSDHDHDDPENGPAGPRRGGTDE